MLQLLLLLLLYESSAQERGELVQCNSELGSCFRVSDTCKQEHTSNGRLETCFPSSQDHTVMGSSGCRYQPCDQESTSELAPLVLQGNSLTVTFNPINPLTYDATISWTASSHRYHTGYKVALLYQYPYEQRYAPSACTCLYTTSLRNYTFYNLRYSTGSMKFEVTSLPYRGYQSDFMISTELSSPTNCQSFDTYDPLHCSPPEYGQVTHTQAVTELFHSPNGLRMSLFLSWQPPETNITRYPLPSAYYLVLVDRSTTTGTCGENPHCFKTSGTLNVTISPLDPDPSRQYEVFIDAYVNCSGLEVEFSTGCSARKAIIIPRPPPPLPSSTFPPSSSTLPPPSSILPPPPHTSTQSQATVTMIHTTGPPASIVQAPAVVNGSIIASTVGAAVILIVMSALVLIYVAVKKQRQREKPHSKPDNVELRDVQRCRRVWFNPKPKKERKKDPLVLVIYSPDSSEEDKQYVLQYLVKDLGKYCRVECHDTIVDRQSAPAWLETKVREASLVLCVCNAQFQREWDQEETSLFPLVFSLVQLVHGILNKSKTLSGKFATVLLRESENECIPDYLRSTRNFLVDEVEVITHFVQGVPEYESSGQS